MRHRLIFFVSFLLIVGVIGCQHENLSNIYDESVHHEFIIDEKGFVYFNDEITVKNNTDKKLSFVMKADVSKEIGLTKEKYAFAYENDSDSYKVFEIEPNSKQSYSVQFKARNDTGKTKTDRNPPMNVIFEIQ